MLILLKCKHQMLYSNYYYQRSHESEIIRKRISQYDIKMLLTNMSESKFTTHLQEIMTG